MSYICTKNKHLNKDNKIFKNVYKYGLFMYISVTTQHKAVCLT